MGKKFKNYSEKELIEVFNKEKFVQEDIKGMMEISETDSDNAIGYFISECKNGVYSESYYDEKGIITV